MHIVLQFCSLRSGSMLMSSIRVWISRNDTRPKAICHFTMSMYSHQIVYLRTKYFVVVAGIEVKATYICHYISLSDIC